MGQILEVNWVSEVKKSGKWKREKRKKREDERMRDWEITGKKREV